jgi:hypothetical protein
MYPKNDPKKFPDVPGDRTPDLVNRHQIVYPLSDPGRDIYEGWDHQMLSFCQDVSVLCKL